MKGKMRLVALLLVLGMVASACAGIPAGTASSGAAAPAPAAAEETAEAVEPAAEPAAEEAAPAEPAAEEEAAPAEAEEAAEPGEIVQISMYMANMQSPSEPKIKQVEEAINAISEKEIGVHVNFQTGNFGQYIPGVTMALASGQPLDIISIAPPGSVQFSAMYASGSLMDISDLVDEFGPDIKSELGDYLGACRVGDGLYMIPNLRIYPCSEYLLVVKSYLEEAGLLEKFENMTTWEEWVEIMEALKEQYGISVLVGTEAADANILVRSGSILSGSGDLGSGLVFDSVGDTVYVLGTDVAADDSTVKILAETDEYVNACKKVAEWYDAGLIYKDAAYETESQEIIVKNGASAAFITTSEMGVEIAKQGTVGKELVGRLLVDTAVTSGVITRFGLAVPATSREPEAAVKFLNFMFTNPEVNNLIDWGIEGEDYQVVDGQAAYVHEGAEWHTQDFMAGNSFLALPWMGNGADYRERARIENENGLISPYLGFMLNTAELTNVITAITSVKTEYFVPLCNGLYTDENYEAYVAKLKTAGIEEYRDAAQAQLDAWLAGK
ncbi:MAG: extracellular solute-binding protein [Lachnospiraceae bacterium]|nr:extracellular solute-binding protein [Lachnospiraceae bacterium]